MPASWLTGAWKPETGQFRWEPRAGRNNSGAVAITFDEASPNVGWWYQEVELDPGSLYNLHGWMKAENVVEREQGNTGANLSRVGTWDHTDSEGSLGTFDWRRISLTLQPDPSGKLSVGCQLGFWCSAVTGKVWFDDLVLSQDAFGPAIEGRHIRLLVEKKDLDPIQPRTLRRWVHQMDRAYAAYEELTGSRPYEGKRIDIVSVRQSPGGWAVAGNPIRWMERFVRPQMQQIETQGDWSFGLLHELSHDFDRAGLSEEEQDRWTWETESSANIKLYWAVRRLNARVHLNGQFYDGEGLKAFYQACHERARAGQSEMSFDCLVYRLIAISEAIGWTPFQKAYRSFLDLSVDEVPKTKLARFDLFVDKLSSFSGRDVRSLIPQEELDWLGSRLNAVP